MEETKVIHQIVKVQYYSDDGRLSDRAYTYYSEATLQVGDIITVPVRDTTTHAKVCAIDVPEVEIAAFKDRVKTIPAQPLYEPNLCDTCQLRKDYPICTADDVEFGKGKGNDNIVRCAHYAKGEAKPSSIPLNTLMIPPSPHLNQPDTDITEPITAIIKVQPESDITILSLLAQANQLRDYAIARVIATDNDMSLAVNDLSVIANIKKSLTAKKAEYWKPIKSHLDAVSATFQTLLTPIEDADRITRDKWTAYRNEQAKRKAEADAINQAKMEIAKREAELNHGEITVDLTPVEAPAPIARVQTDMGTVGIVKNRKYRVVDFAKLPDQYKIENSALLNKVVKAGIPSIDGVEIYIEEGLRVSAK